MISIRCLSEQDEEKYQSFLNNRKDSLIYYSLQYKCFLEELLGCKSYYLIALEDDEICGIFPLMSLKGQYGNVINSLPYYGSQGSILANSPETEQALYDYAFKNMLESSVASTIITHPFHQDLAYRPKFNFTDERIGQWTPLQSTEEKLYTLIDAPTRRNIRKAQNSKIQVSTNNTREAWEFLKQTHKDNMEKINGNAKSSHFFKLVPKYFRPEQDYNIYVAYLDGIKVAALLIFYFGQTVEYYTPVTKSDYRNLQPSALVIKIAMLEAYQKGHRWWNWGGTWKEQEGVYRFKKKWGAKEFPYKYYTFVSDSVILKKKPQVLSEIYPGFYVVPFNSLSVMM